MSFGLTGNSDLSSHGVGKRGSGKSAVSIEPSPFSPLRPFSGPLGQAVTLSCGCHLGVKA